MNTLSKILLPLVLVTAAFWLGGCASTGGAHDAPFDKMIVKDRADYWKVPPGGGASPDGQFSRGQRLRVVGQLSGYLEVQTTGGSTVYVEPNSIGDLSESPVQPRINF